jgi:hypothetical protein
MIEDRPEEDGPASPATRFREVAIIGGGCYGTFYAGQLARALDRGRIIADRIVMVDRDPTCQATREAPRRSPFALTVMDWGEYLDRLLAAPAPDPGDADDAIVPSPLMPHLMAEWLVRFATAAFPDHTVALEPVSAPVGTPYDVLAPDGNRYVSFADWLCPTHCVEPFICPVTQGPRTWEMGDALVDYVRREGRHRRLVGPALFSTRHRAFGVGMFDAAEARGARRLLEQTVAERAEALLLVATISSCHGATSLLAVRPR